MSSFTRCILRYGIIGGLALGGVTLLVGPDRVAAGLAHLRTKAQNVVDTAMDDPEALRSQLERLAEQYPDRISEVRGEIAEVDHQIAQFERDIEISKRVVAMTTDDLQNLKELVARAEVEAGATTRVVNIRYEGVRFDIDQAYAEGNRISTVRNTYADRLAHDKVQLDFLSEQKSRLTEILDQLEDEFNTYQAQLWQLDRQIDAIQRNERLIELTKEQQATLKSYEKFGKVQNLKQLEAKLAELRQTQEAQLEYLSKSGLRAGETYEKRAVRQLDDAHFESNPFVEVFELEPDEEDDEDEDPTVAWAGPVIVE